MADSQNKRRQSNPEYYISRWRTALELQDKRIRSAEDQLCRQIDTDLYALVLRNLVRAVEYAANLTKNDDIQKALKIFKEAVPGWINVRNFLEHFDEYAQGKGKLQKKEEATVYGPYYAEEERYDANGALIAKNYYLSFGEGNHIDIATATHEAGTLADTAFKVLSYSQAITKN